MVVSMLWPCELAPVRIWTFPLGSMRMVHESVAPRPKGMAEGSM